MKTVQVMAVASLALLPGCRATDPNQPLVLNGRIEATFVDLAPKVAGRVVEVRVREGDRVKAGDVLIRLDLGETALAVGRDERGVEAAEARFRDLAAGSRAPEVAAATADVLDKRAAVDLARRELDRQQFLRTRKVGNQRDLDRAQVEFDRTQAALSASEERLRLVREGFRRWQTEQARVEVGRARSVLEQTQAVARESEVRAPADGVILHRLAEPGQLLGPGQAGVTMAFADRLYVRTFIPETKLGIVRSGQAVEVRVDAFPGRRFPARVAEIAPDAEFTPKPVETREERVNLVYAAKVDLDAGWDAPLVPGQPAEVIVAGAAAAAAPAAPSTSSPPQAPAPAPGASGTDKR
jgi:HlyD family secretion protein